MSSQLCWQVWVCVQKRDHLEILSNRRLDNLSKSHDPMELWIWFSKLNSVCSLYNSGSLLVSNIASDLWKIFTLKSHPQHIFSVMLSKEEVFIELSHLYLARFILQISRLIYKRGLLIHLNTRDNLFRRRYRYHLCTTTTVKVLRLILVGRHWDNTLSWIRERRPE